MVFHHVIFVTISTPPGEHTRNPMRRREEPDISLLLASCSIRTLTFHQRATSRIRGVPPGRHLTRMQGSWCKRWVCRVNNHRERYGSMLYPGRKHTHSALCVNVGALRVWCMLFLVEIVTALNVRTNFTSTWMVSCSGRSIYLAVQRK